MARVEFRLAEPNPAEGLMEVVLKDTEERIYVHERIHLSNEDIIGVEAGWSIDVGALVVTLTEAGGEKLASVTRANVGRLFCMLLDGEALVAPTIRAPIGKEDLILTGWWYSEKEARRVADAIMGHPVPPLDIDELLADLQSSHWQERHVAAHHLGKDEQRCRVGAEALINALGDERPRVSRGIKESLVSYGIAAVPLLKDALHSRNADHVVEVLEIISIMGSEAETLKPTLINLLDDPRPPVRVGAARSMVQVSVDRGEVVPHLVQLLDKYGPERKVIELIGSAGPEAAPAVPALINHLWASHEERGRMNRAGATAYALVFTRIGPVAEAAVPDLVRLMGYLPEDLRDSVCDSLFRDAPSNASDFMRHPERRLCSGQRLRQRCAASALGSIHSQPDVSVPALLQAMREQQYLQRNAILALAAFGEAARVAIPDLEKIHGSASGDLKTAVAVALGCTKGDCSPYIDELTELLSNVEWSVRAFAARKLGEAGTAAAPAVPRLRELQSDDESAVQEAAVWAVARIVGD
jgi:HEAT repeat protein